MIQKYIDTLNKVRNNEIGIGEFYYKKALDAGGHGYDENEKRRYQLLIALQYDDPSRDEALIRDLFVQEIIMHKTAPFQGLSKSIQLNAFLLSRFKNPENVWLFLEAKRANFDTNCGFDYEYLVSAGIKETYDLVDRSDAGEAKENFYYVVGESAATCHITVDDLEEWAKGRMIYYDVKADDLEQQILLADELGEHDILKEKIAQWKSEQKQWSRETLYRLSAYERLAKDIRGQIFAYERSLLLETKDWDKCSLLLELSKLYLETEQADVAWDKIRSAQKHLKKIPDWKKVGLGRFIIETTFAVVLAFNDPKNPQAKEAFSWATREVKGMEGLYQNLLEKAAKATVLMKG